MGKSIYYSSKAYEIRTKGAVLSDQGARIGQTRTFSVRMILLLVALETVLQKENAALPRFLKTYLLTTSTYQMQMYFL